MTVTYTMTLQHKFAYLACASKRVSPGQDMLVSRFSPLCASWITGTAYQPLQESKNNKNLDISATYIGTTGRAFHDGPQNPFQ